VVISQINKD
jgi:transposase InsO family protein